PRPHMPQLHSARLTVSAVASEHEDSLTVKRTVLLRLDTEIVPGGQKITEARRHPGQARPAAWFGPANHDVLDLWMSPLGRAEVPALMVGVDRAHEVHVRGHPL